MGFRFRLHRRDLPGKPEIVLPKHRLVVLFTAASGIRYWGGGAPRPMKMGTYMRLHQSRGFLLEVRFLASQEAWVCIHDMLVPLLCRAFAVKPQRPQGCAFWRKGLTAKARAER